MRLIVPDSHLLDLRRLSEEKPALRDPTLVQYLTTSEATLNGYDERRALGLFGPAGSMSCSVCGPRPVGEAVVEILAGDEDPFTGAETDPVRLCASCLNEATNLIGAGCKLNEPA